MINIEDIKQQLSINKVLGYYLKGDSSLSGTQKYLSPFKKERTPSLVASDEKWIWKDFSSWKGGDIFRFVKEYKGYNFFETLNEFNSIFWLNIDLSQNEFDKEAAKKQALIYEIHDLVIKFCQSALVKSLVQVKYLKEQRCLSQDTIERFDIWFSKWRDLEMYVSSILKDEKYSIIKIQDISLFNDKGSFLFVDRIMFPVKTMFWKTVAFSWGRIRSDQEPKYIHSTNNFIYEKSHNLLNIDKVDFLTRDVFICEWNIDTIQLYNYGGTKSLALLWISLSDSQINSFINRIDEVTLLLDNDWAWTRAMYEIAKKFYARWKMVYVFNLWKYKDIDEFLIWNENLKGNIDNYIDDNKKEILLEVLIPSYIKNELSFDIKTRKELFEKIKDLYISIPNFYDSLKRNCSMELKKGDIDFYKIKDFSNFEDLGYPELTKEQAFDMTGRDVQEYNRLRKDFLKKLRDMIKNQEKLVQELDISKVAKYITITHQEIAERINRNHYGMDIKLKFNELLKSLWDNLLDEEFLNNVITIDFVLNENPDEFIKNNF